MTDQRHASAFSSPQEMERESTRMITTQPVLLEIGGALARQRFRAAAVALLSALETYARGEFVALTAKFYAEARRLVDQRTDKEGLSRTARPLSSCTCADYDKR
jgi:hypothetical protein